ncbi:MAG: helix-turn-helix transcriptional regulator [Actinomycetota bacterium]
MHNRLLRESAGLTRSDLAQVVKVDPSTISRWESGLRVPRGATRQRYEDALAELEAALR